jgi:hypothetical protein
MLKFKDVENLPHDHPLYQEFLRELEREASMLPPLWWAGEDEESKDYFDRYVAGDKH